MFFNGGVAWSFAACSRTLIPTYTHIHMCMCILSAGLLASANGAILINHSIKLVGASCVFLLACCNIYLIFFSNDFVVQQRIQQHHSTQNDLNRRTLQPAPTLRCALKSPGTKPFSSQLPSLLLAIVCCNASGCAIILKLSRTHKILHLPVCYCCQSRQGAKLNFRNIFRYRTHAKLLRFLKTFGAFRRMALFVNNIPRRFLMISFRW